MTTPKAGMPGLPSAPKRYVPTDTGTMEVLVEQELIGHGFVSTYEYEILRACSEKLTAYAAQKDAEVERLRIFIADAARMLRKPEYADADNRSGLAIDCDAVAGNEMSLKYLDVRFQIERAVAAESRLAAMEANARRYEELLRLLVEQIEKGNPVDDHGHDFKMSREFINGREYVSAHKL